MTEEPLDYAVGYQRPPLYSRFRKGHSGNPEGGRRHRRDRTERLPALLKEALDMRPASARGRVRRPATRREAIVIALVEKCVAGDLRAVKLLLDLIQKTEFARLPEAELGEEDPREFLIRTVDRLAAEEAAKEGGEVSG
ncbi:MAG: DUF5681 domain-containing protein [Stellaceae bacterium]